MLQNFPRLKVCVPHMGFDEVASYRNLIEKYDTLWLDTTMILAEYFPAEETIALETYRAERILYGSDFPNIPYAWDRELRWLATSGLEPDALEWILHKSAAQLFDIEI